MVPRLSRSAVWLSLSLLAVTALLFLPRSTTPKRPKVHQASENPRDSAAKRKAMASFLHSSLPFEANLGQTDPAAKFIARGMRYSVFFTRQGVILRLADPQSKGQDNVL